MTRLIDCPKCGASQPPSARCVAKECDADLNKVKSSLHGLRFHDLRHHAITELAEGSTSDQVIMSIAGHVSPRMLAHYSHVRTEAKRKGLDALATRHFDEKKRAETAGYATNHDTKESVEESQSFQVVELNGGDDGTRTRGLCRDRAAF